MDRFFLSMAMRKAWTSWIETLSKAGECSGQAMPGEPDESHDVLAIRALGVGALPARDPRFKDIGDGKEKLLDALAYRGRGVTDENRRQLRLSCSFYSRLGYGLLSKGTVTAGHRLA
jgi:hypothetical protein